MHMLSNSCGMMRKVSYLYEKNSQNPLTWLLQWKLCILKVNQLFLKDLNKYGYNESHIPLILYTVRKVLLQGGHFVLGFVGRRILNASSILPMLYKQAEDMGFKQIPLTYRVNNTSVTANFGFSIIVAWKVPSIEEVPLVSSKNIKKNEEGNLIVVFIDSFFKKDEEFLKMFDDPTGITDDE